MTDTIVSERRFFNALMREDFGAFLEKTFSHLNPGTKFQPNWHLKAIAHKLALVRAGKITRLIINMPPRSLKSIVASVAFPAYALGHNPYQRIFAISYSGGLAEKHAADHRSVVESPWYRSAFPTRCFPVLKKGSPKEAFVDVVALFGLLQTGTLRFGSPVHCPRDLARLVVILPHQILDKEQLVGKCVRTTKIALHLQTQLKPINFFWRCVLRKNGHANVALTEVVESDATCVGVYEQTSVADDTRIDLTDVL
jgi:hypothetical protein